MGLEGSGPREALVILSFFLAKTNLGVSLSLPIKMQICLIPEQE